MIVLDRIDTAGRSASLKEVEIPGTGTPRDRDRVDELIKRLGVEDVQFCEAVEGSRLLDHRWVYYDDCMHYEAKFPHTIESAGVVAFYTALALATGAPEDESALIQLRLAVYELALNVLEHGRPNTTDPVLSVGFKFGEHEVGGWIQDQCERFNPSEMSNHGWGQRVAVRARRGYGIMIVHRLLDTLEHEYNHGNRIIYSKKVQA